MLCKLFRFQLIKHEKPHFDEVFIYSKKIYILLLDSKYSTIFFWFACLYLPKYIDASLFRMGLFGAAHWWGGGKKASLPKIQWSYNDETWYKHVLHKEDLKYIWITWHTPWILLTSEFFQRKSANLAISRNTNIDCILVHNFCFFLRSGFAASSII